MKKSVLLVGAFFAFVSATAFASLKEDKVKEEVGKRISYQQERWKKATGVDMPITVDWKALGEFCTSSNPEQQSWACNGAGIVGRGVDALTDIPMSISDNGKKELETKAIKSKFKKIVITKSSSDKIEVTATGGALTYKVPVGKGSNNSVGSQESIAWRKVIEGAL